MQAPSRSRRRPPSEARRRILRALYPAPAESRPRWLERRLLRAGEVAVLLQVSRRSVASWARQGLIPFIETPGGHRRFRAADVRALVASLRQHPHDSSRSDSGPRPDISPRSSKKGEQRA